ncbi:MAG: peptidase U32 family protein [Alphaproteobacteria bacterium]
MNAGRLELVCPAGTPAASRAAIDAGADAIYLGFRDATNARNFPGLNFSRAELADALSYAHARGRKVYVAVNTFPRAGEPGPWHRAVDDAAALGADAVILADLGLLDYTARHHPKLRRHLSVQASASNAESILFYYRAFAIKRVILPRVLTVADIAALNRQIPVETEVFVFGGMCTMAEGRCVLSSYLTGRSPNKDGICSPPEFVRYVEEGGRLAARLGGVTIDEFGRDEAAGYPTLCKGRFVAGGRAGYLFEEPVSLNATSLLPDLKAAGVRALKIEGRQRGRAYVREVVAAFRRAVDACEGARRAQAKRLDPVAEGQRGTRGAYRKGWR